MLLDRFAARPGPNNLLMCGRFTYRYSWSDLHRLMRLTTPDAPLFAITPRFNVAPTQSVPVVYQHGQTRTASLMKWGLVPFWAKDPAIGNMFINARSEEAAGKPAFRDAFKRHRCLIPATGFYEWQRIEGSKHKQPWLIRVKDVPLFAFAGLYDTWRERAADGDAAETHLETFTILTGKPNDLVAPIHNRMPVIVRPEHYDLWLDPSVHEPDAVARVLEPLPAEQMEAVRIGSRVNSPAIDDASLLDPCPEPPRETLW